MENKKKYRHEFKYMLNKGWYEILRQRVKAVMKPDSHGNNGIYRITSLYLDDVFDSAYNDKLMGLDVRKKYRIRFYSLSPEFIRLEIKEKKGEMVSKRSAKMTYDDYKSLLQGDKSFLTEERFSGTVGEDLYASDQSVRISPAAVVDGNGRVKRTTEFLQRLRKRRDHSGGEVRQLYAFLHTEFVGRSAPERRIGLKICVMQRFQKKTCKII